jgi:hypothetical protein
MSISQKAKSFGAQVIGVVTPTKLFLSVDECGRVFNPERNDETTIAIDIEAGSVKSTEPSLHLFESLEITMHKMVESINNLPQRASHSWDHLPLLLVGLVVGSGLIYMLIYVLPLSDVNSGIQTNRSFQYGILTYYEFLSLLTWVTTFSYAMPKDAISLRRRILSILVAISVEKVFDFLVTESRSSTRLFPIPFVNIVSGVFALPVVVGMMFCLLPKPKEANTMQKFKLTVCTVVMFALSYVIALLWAAVFKRLNNSLWQKAWAISFGILHFLCKTILVAPIALRLNPERFVFLQFVVGMIFTRVQMATLPYIDGPLTLIALLLPKVFTLFFRFWAGFERFNLIVTFLWKKVIGDKKAIDNLHDHFAATTVLEVAMRCAITASVQDIHNAGIRLASDNQKQEYTEWDFNSNFASESVLEIISAQVCDAVSLVPDNQSNERSTDTDSDTDTETDTDIDTDTDNNTDTNGDSDNDTNTDADNYNHNNQCICPAHDEGFSELSHEMYTIKEEPNENDDLDDEAQLGGFDIKSTKSDDSLPSSFLCEDSICTELDHELDDGDMILEEMENGSIQGSYHTSRPVVPDNMNESDDNKDGDLAVNASQKHKESNWQQRQLYNIVDSVGSEVLGTMILLQNLVSISVIHRLPIKSHLNETAHVSDERLRESVMYGFVLVTMSLLVLAFLNIPFRSLQNQVGRKLTLAKIVSYIFRDNFWFLFLWLTVTGTISVASLVQHFGADFSFKFLWLSCSSSGQIAWPGCADGAL